MGARACRLERHRPPLPVFLSGFTRFGGWEALYFPSSPCRWGVALIGQKLSPNGTETCPGPHWPLHLMGQLLTDSLVTLPPPQTWQPQESPP